MAGALRGGSRVRAKPPAKTPPKAARRAAAPARETSGLSPRLALIGAVVILALALGATLATGHRGQRLVAAIGTGIDARFGEAGFRLRTIEVQGASTLSYADRV